MACVISLGSAVYGAEPAAEKKPLRLMTIGNSFSQNATTYLKDLAAAGHHPLQHLSIVIGGAPLALHWEMAQQAEEPPGKGAYTDGKTLRQKLESEPWDTLDPLRRCPLPGRYRSHLWP